MILSHTLYVYLCSICILVIFLHSLSLYTYKTTYLCQPHAVLYFVRPLFTFCHTITMNNELNKALDNGYMDYVQHIDAITSLTVGSLDFSFNGEHTYTCMCKLVQPLTIQFWNFAIEDFFVIFEVTGIISKDKLIYNGQHGLVNTCSFWVESPNSGVMCTLELNPSCFACCCYSALPVDISQVYGEDLDTGKMTLLIQWACNGDLELLNVSVFDQINGY